MKRIICLTLAAAMALTLAACGGDPRFNENELTEAQAYTKAAMDSCEVHKNMEFKGGKVMLTSDLAADLSAEVEMEVWDVSDVTAMVLAEIGPAEGEDSQETTAADAGETGQALFLLDSEKNVVYTRYGAQVDVSEAVDSPAEGSDSDRSELRRQLAQAELAVEDFLEKSGEDVKTFAAQVEETLAEDPEYLYSKEILAACTNDAFGRYAELKREAVRLETRLTSLEEGVDEDLLDSNEAILAQRVDTLALLAEVDSRIAVTETENQSTLADPMAKAEEMKAQEDYLYSEAYLRLCLSSEPMNLWDDLQREKKAYDIEIAALEKALGTEDLEEREYLQACAEVDQAYLTDYSAAMKTYVRALMDQEAFESTNAADLKTYDDGVAAIKKAVGADYEEDIDYLKLEIKYETLIQDRAEREEAVSASRAAADSAREAADEKRAELDQEEADRQNDIAVKADQEKLWNYVCGEIEAVSEYEAQPGQWGQLHKDYAAWQNENLNYYEPYSYSGSSSSSGSSYSSDDGASYDPDDPYYSANDHNGDGKINGDEFQDAMGDAIDDLYNEMYGGGYSYNSSDPYYSANDHNGDGKINDQEFQDALGDYMDDIMGY